MSRLSSVWDLFRTDHGTFSSRTRRGRRSRAGRVLVGRRALRLEALEQRALLSLTVGINQYVPPPLGASAFQADPTNVSPINFKAVFSQSIDASTFTAADVSLTGSTATASVTNIFNLNPGADPGDNTIFGVEVSPTTDGTVVASILAGGVQDALHTVVNLASTSTDNVVTYDTTQPSVTINQAIGQTDPTTTLPIHFTAVFNEQVSTLTNAGITGIPAGAVCTITPQGVAGTTFDIAVSGLNADTTLTPGISAGAVTDLAGNPNTASTSTDGSVFFNVPLAVDVEQNAGQVDPTNFLPMFFTAQFNEAINAATFTESDITVGGTTLGAAVVPGSLVAQGGNLYLFQVAVPAGPGHDGIITASIAAGAVADTTGELNTASTSLDNTVTFDATPPTVTINQAVGQADPASPLPLQPPDGVHIHFTAQFSEHVGGFGAGSLTGVPGGAVVVVTPTGATTYDIDVSNLTAHGTVVLSIAAGAVTDDAGNANLASFSTDNSVTFNIPLAVDVEQAPAQADPTNSNLIGFTAEFNEAIDVSTFTAADITLGGTAAGAYVVPASLTGLGGNLYGFNVIVPFGLGKEETVTASIAAGMVSDGYLGGNSASTSVDNTVTYDTTAPDVTVNQTPTQVDPVGGTAAAAGVQFVVHFSEDMNPLTVSPSDLTVTQLPGGTLSWVILYLQVDARTWDFQVVGLGPDEHGTLVATFNADAASDLAGNLNNASTSTDNQVTVDTNELFEAVSPAPGQLPNSNVSPVNFSVQFTAPVTNFDASKVDLTGSTAFQDGFPNVVVTGSGADYNVAVSGMTRDGIVVLTVPAGVIFDQYGNANQFTGVNAVDYQRVLTVDVEQAPTQPDPNGVPEIDFVAKFTEPVVDFGADRITLGGTALGASIESIYGAPVYDPGPGGTPGTWDFDFRVHGMTTNGTVVASVAPGIVHDAEWQANGVVPSTDNTVTYVAAPTVTINQAIGQADPTSTGPINFTVVFSQAVTGFTAADVSFLGSSAFTQGALTVAPVVVVTGSGTTYNVAVSGMISDGLVVATVLPNAAVGGAGGLSLDSTSTDNLVFYNLPLAVTVNQAVGQADPTNQGPIHFTAKFNEPVRTFSSASISLAGTTAAGATVEPLVVPADGMTWDIVVSGMTGDGVVVVSIPPGAAADLNGEVNASASTSTDNSVTYSTAAGPTIYGVVVAEATHQNGILESNEVGVITWADLDANPVTSRSLTVDGHAAAAQYGPFGPQPNGAFFNSGTFGPLTAGLHGYVISETDSLGHISTHNGSFNVAAAPADAVAAGPDVYGVMVVEANNQNGVLQPSEQGVVTWAVLDPSAVTSHSLTVDGSPATALFGPYGPQANGAYFYSGTFTAGTVGSHNFTISVTDTASPAATYNGSFNVAERLTLDAVGTPLAAPAPVTDAQLAPIVAEAQQRLTAALGAQAVAALSNVSVQVADLPNNLLGEWNGRTILINRNAAGYGWFIDPTPGDDAEFLPAAGGGPESARPGTAAYGRVDLLTTVMHEMGHVLGYDDIQSATDGLMDAKLAPGVREMLTDLALTQL